MSDLNTSLKSLYDNLRSVVLGKEDAIFFLLAALLARGHVLLEDVPGTGKTLLAKTVARSLHAKFTRLQCTPDLMPSDVTGVSVYRQDRQAFEFVPGPAFTDVLLADEINRATPRAQSCLLECMEERQITVDGETRPLPSTFFVIATQNPVGFYGTYPLPEAQLDRFLMRIRPGYPSAEHEAQLIAQRIAHDPLDAVQRAMGLDALGRLQAAVQQVEIVPDVLRYISALVRATREHDAVALGASPRASVALMRASQSTALLSGHKQVTPDHVKKVAVPVLAHRFVLKHASDSAAAERVVREVLTRCAAPVARAA